MEYHHTAIATLVVPAIHWKDVTIPRRPIVGLVSLAGSAVMVEPAFFWFLVIMSDV